MMAKARKPKHEAETANSVVFTVRIEPELAAAVDAFCDSQEFPIPRSAFIARAMIELLERKGAWPPKTKA